MAFKRSAVRSRLSPPQNTDFYHKSRCFSNFLRKSKNAPWRKMLCTLWYNTSFLTGLWYIVVQFFRLLTDQKRPAKFFITPLWLGRRCRCTWIVWCSECRSEGSFPAWNVPSGTALLWSPDLSLPLHLPYAIIRLIHNHPPTPPPPKTYSEFYIRYRNVNAAGQ